MSVNKIKTAIVLSGGGAKGAYEAGVLKYIIENWGLKFDIVVGTSAGAFNSFIYSNLDFLDSNKNNGEKMIKPWKEIKFNNIIKIPFKNYIFGKFVSFFGNEKLRKFSSKHFNQDVQDLNIKNKNIETIIVTTGEIGSSESHVWYTTNNQSVSMTSDRWVSHKCDSLNVDYAIASGAIPCVFPPVELNVDGKKQWHIDGGITMNTPISPAINAGAQKIIVIYLGNPNGVPYESIPDICSIIGGVGTITMYNHLKEDIIRANTINRLLVKLGQDSFDKYKKIQLKVIRPQVDIDEKISHKIKNLNFFTKYFIPKTVLKLLSGTGMFMDGLYTNQIIDLGYNDAKNMHNELKVFFENDKF